MPYNDIVIVGAGPIGLYTAIKLKQMGLNPIVIDPRLGIYTRPGIFGEDVFDEVKKNIGDDAKDMKPSDSLHIKDLERELFKIATTLKIDMRAQTFKGMQNKKVLVSQPQKELKEDDSKQDTKDEKTIPCDLVIDATGKKRVVLNFVNEFEKTRKNSVPFEAEKVAENPLKNRLLAYVNVPKESQQLLDKKALPEIKPLVYAKTLIEMRKRFGWHHYADPRLYFINLGKEKTCFNIDTPPGFERLKKAKQLEWLKLLLRLECSQDIPCSEIELKSTSKYPSKKRIVPYHVDPHLVRKAFFSNGILPDVIPVGDTQIDAEPILALGVVEGIKRVNSLLAAIEVELKNGRVKNIDVPQHQLRVESLIENFKKQFEAEYTQTRLDLLNSLERTKNIFTLALNEANEEEAREIKAHLAEINRQLAEEKFKNALEAKKNNKEKFDLLNLSKKLLSLSLNQAMEVPKQSHFVSRKKIDALLKKIAVNAYHLAKECIANKNFQLAEKYYLLFLDIVEKRFQDEFFENKFQAYTDLVVFYNQSHQSDKVKSMSESALAIAPKVSDSKNKTKNMHKITQLSKVASLSENKQALFKENKRKQTNKKTPAPSKLRHDY